MVVSRGTGPEIVIAGAARSGTTLLAAQLAAHPDIDAGTVKEPNYFSRHYDRGAEWYEELFAKRSRGALRLDASTSYTYPQFPEALRRLAEASPTAFVVYSVRDPLPRAVSHYLFYRYYFRREPAKDFATALRADSYYLDVSDYARWLPQLRANFPEDRLLVVPFEALTGAPHDVASLICRSVGLPPPPVADQRVAAHQNHVVEFRADSLRRLAKVLRHDPRYLRIRASVGPHRLRRVRSLLTRQARMPSVEQALASCDERQLGELRVLEVSARAAVLEYLTGQDAQRGLEWAPFWTPR